ncbi:MAG: DoxX family membrane protein [Pseudonocardiaceae bacterium]|nr:DoxX family membrane protein [Pseudonocardiaceae bacterium]
MLLRRVARPLLAAIFVSGGINELRNPAAHADAVKPLLDMTKGALPDDFDPSNPRLVQVDGGVKVGAGTLLALGRMPRLSATLLATSLVPTTLGAHAFWEINDSAERGNQQIQFFKNAGMLGGLLLAACDTGGKPSLAHQVKQSRRQAKREAKRRGGEMSRRARKAARRAERRAAKSAGQVRRSLDEGTRKGRKLAERARR